MQVSEVKRGLQLMRDHLFLGYTTEDWGFVDAAPTVPHTVTRIKEGVRLSHL
jgi:hypothetical protein